MKASTFMRSNHKIRAAWVNERLGLKASSELDFGFVRDFASYALGFAAGTATIYF